MDTKIKKEFKWDPYVLLRNDQVSAFTCTHFASEDKKVLYIMGEGFDFRMNLGLQSLLQQCPSLSIHCFLIQYDEGRSSSSKRYKPFVKENRDALHNLVDARHITEKKIDLWTAEGKRKKRVGDQNVADLFNDPQMLQPYTDIFVDISALPRGIYFSLVGKVQAILDQYFVDEEKNFYLVTAENAGLDAKIKDYQPDSELSYVFGYRGGSELTSDKKQTIWLPILGEGMAYQIRAAYEKIKPNEICPVLPFPSKDPRRSDALLIEYHQLLFDELNIEGQNIIYVPEQNPFEVYRTLAQTILDYNETLAVIKGCDVVISTFSSKLLSIGALLCAHEFKTLNSVKVGILNVDASGYEVEKDGFDESVRDRSELFLLWLAGEPYKI